MTGNLPDSEVAPSCDGVYEAVLGWLTPLAVDLVISTEGTVRLA